METLHLPAASLGAAFTFDTGEGREGTDTTIKLNLTKTLPTSITFHRLHANIHTILNGDSMEGERENLMKYVFGYQTRMGTDSMLVFDYVYEEDFMKEKEIELLEAGIRHQFNPLTILAFGIGGGLNEESPETRATVGFQRALNIFY